MSAGSVSLQSAIQTCKVNTGWANRIESDRFLNPNQMLCPIWNGMDTQGRNVCPDSFYTKRAGCNSALDRVQVENNQRPQYIEYVALSALGIEGPGYEGVNGGDDPKSMHTKQATQFLRTRQNAHKYTGSFGNQFAELEPSCGIYPYERAMANQSEGYRYSQSRNLGYETNQRRSCSGF